MARNLKGSSLWMKINSSKPKDREDLFREICKTMCLDLEAELNKIEVKFDVVPAKGNKEKGIKFFLSNENLLSFFSNQKLQGAFNFEEKNITVLVPEYYFSGEDLIKHPELIPQSPVDARVPTKKEEEVLGKSETEVEDDDDPLFD